MKYGQQLEHESVPEWRLHNLDYDSLKREIKAHTTHHQATPTAIPGHPDLALCRFEDGLYIELERQHHRLDLFVTSKADEISRRLEHLDSNVQRWIRKYANGGGSSVSLKRQRRFARYERELLRCGHDILALSRFVNAQVVAFRKILKKYRKWTGSVSLTSRFNQNVLGNPKSFTRRDFDPLQVRHDEILADLGSSSAFFSEPSSPSTDSQSHLEPPSPRKPRVTFKTPPPTRSEPRVQYWNEYDDGSEGGGPEDEYAIYINPEAHVGFPGLAYMRAITTVPYEKAKQWFERRRHGDEERPLPPPAAAERASLRSYSSTALDSEEDSACCSDGPLPRGGPYGGSPSALVATAGLQAAARDRARDRALTRATAACFVASSALLALAGVLLGAGRRRLRVEVDAGVTAGVLLSLLCACGGLGLTLCRSEAPRLLHRLLVWAVFVASCLCSGVLLVLVLGSAP